MDRYVLMLEHDDDDRYITQQMFDEHGAHVKIQFVYKSNEVVEYLHRCKESYRQFPSLILLNYYSLPFTSIEVLRSIKSNQDFRRIPVIILSGTVSAEIVNECYAEGASSFIQKPASDLDTNRKIISFIDYWFHTIILP